MVAFNLKRASGLSDISTTIEQRYTLSGVVLNHLWTVTCINGLQTSCLIGSFERKLQFQGWV